MPKAVVATTMRSTYHSAVRRALATATRTSPLAARALDVKDTPGAMKRRCTAARIAMLRPPW